MTTAGNDISYVPNSYWVVGNPWNPNPGVPSINADLVGMSDHYPVVVDLEVSKAVGLANELDNGIRLHALNPVSDILRGSLIVPGGLEEQFGFSLLGMDGKVVWESEKEFVSGEHAFEFDLSAISGGIYFFVATGETAPPLMRKLVLMD